MLFSKEDFQVESISELFSFLLMLPFIAFVMPFLGAVWTMGLIADKVGWLDT